MTRLASTGCEDKLSSELTVARLGEKNGERESERVLTQRMTMKLLGRWEGGGRGQENSAKQRVRAASPCEWGRGRAGQGDWQVAGRSPMERLERFWAKALSGDRRWAVVIDCPVPNA